MCVHVCVCVCVNVYTHTVCVCVYVCVCVCESYLAVSDQQLVDAVLVQADVIRQRKRRRLVRQLL